MVYWKIERKNLFKGSVDEIYFNFNPQFYFKLKAWTNRPNCVFHSSCQCGIDRSMQSKYLSLTVPERTAGIALLLKLWIFSSSLVSPETWNINNFESSVYNLFIVMESLENLPPKLYPLHTWFSKANSFFIHRRIIEIDKATYIPIHERNIWGGGNLIGILKIWI